MAVRGRPANVADLPQTRGRGVEQQGEAGLPTTGPRRSRKAADGVAPGLDDAGSSTSLGSSNFEGVPLPSALVNLEGDGAVTVPLANADFGGPANGTHFWSVQPSIENPTGWLGQSLLEYADSRMAALRDRAPQLARHFEEQLSSLNSEVKRTLVMLAIGAGRSRRDVDGLVAQVRQRTDEAALALCSLSSPDGDNLRQVYVTSCGPSVAQVMRTMVDPIYAMKLNLAGTISGVDGRQPEKGNPLRAEHQKSMLLAIGGVPAPLAQPQGARGANARALFEAAILGHPALAELGLTFSTFEVGEPKEDQALVDSRMDLNIPVPIIVGKNRSDDAHYNLIMARRYVGEAPNLSAEYLVYDPKGPSSDWMPWEKVDDRGDQVMTSLVLHEVDSDSATRQRAEWAWR